MGHQAHPTTVPKQLQNNGSDKNSIEGKSGSSSYELRNNDDDTLIEVRKNGSFEGYIFMSEIVDQLE